MKPGDLTSLLTLLVICLSPWTRQNFPAPLKREQTLSYSNKSKCSLLGACAILFCREAAHVADYNTELNDLRKIICLRKSEVFVKKNSVFNVIHQNLVKHDIDYLPCSYTNDIINILASQL